MKLKNVNNKNTQHNSKRQNETLTDTKGQNNRITKKRNSDRWQKKNINMHLKTLWQLCVLRKQYKNFCGPSRLILTMPRRKQVLPRQWATGSSTESVGVVCSMNCTCGTVEEELCCTPSTLPHLLQCGDRSRFSKWIYLFVKATFRRRWARGFSPERFLTREGAFTLVTRVSNSRI